MTLIAMPNSAFLGFIKPTPEVELSIQAQSPCE